jgi:hypothetical protein
MLVVRKNKYAELEKLRKKSNLVRLVEGMLLGAAIGLLLGFLFAPKEGDETRGLLTTKAKGWCSKCMGLFKGGCCCCAEEESDDLLEEE